MRRPLIRRSPAALALFCLLAGAMAEVRADPVVLTSGTARSEGPRPFFNSINVSGANFMLAGNDIPPAGGSLMSVFLTRDSNSTLVFNGITYFPVAAVQFTNTLLTGRVTAYALFFDRLENRNPLFTLDVVGSGFFALTGTPPFQTGTFTVTNQPNLIPEPASLILLGTALAGLAARKRARP